MTAYEWETCRDPTQLIEFARPATSERKLRLYTIACCRRVCEVLPDRSRERVFLEALERYADGVEENAIRRAVATSTTTLAEIRLAASVSMIEWTHQHMCTAGFCAFTAAKTVASFGSPLPYGHGERRLEKWNKALCDEQFEQCALARDIFPRPDLGTLDFAAVHCLPQVVKYAEDIYYLRRFDLMPQLAMLLQACGAPRALVDHCLADRVHVRGCWALDAILRRS